MICNNCGRAFDEPATAHQMHYEVDTLREESYSICPYCESEEIEESDHCPVCDSEKQKAEDYCNNCDAAIHEMVEELLDNIRETFCADYDTALEWVTYDIERRN